MSKKVIFFSIDRLGDYLIRSNVIYKISQNFKHKEIVGSDLNTKLLSTQNFFNTVYMFNTKNKFIEKIKFTINFFLKQYEVAIAFDGKNISNILLLLIRSNFKFTFLYIKKSFFNKLYLKFITKFYDLLNIKYEFLFSRDLIEKKNYDNYPEKYMCLKKYFNNIDTDIYYYKNDNINDYDIFKDQFIIIHLDEKFTDIHGIDKDFSASLLDLQKKIKKKIFLTTFKNNFRYYKFLSHNKIEFQNISLEKLKNSNILIIEDMPLNHMYNLIENSLLNISCHSGYFVHTSLSLNKKTIDILNKSDEIWYNTWIHNKNNYEIINKSTLQKKINIKNILNLIVQKII